MGGLQVTSTIFNKDPKGMEKKVREGRTKRAQDERADGKKLRYVEKRKRLRDEK
jgi:hypothetical protein